MSRELDDAITEYLLQNMGNFQNSGLQTEFPEEHHERTKQSKFPTQGDDHKDFRLVESDLLNEKKIENMEKALNDISQKRMKPKANPLTSTYKERKDYEINEEVFSRGDQLRFSSLSMQLLGITKRPIKDGGKLDFSILVFLLLLFIGTQRN